MDDKDKTHCWRVTAWTLVVAGVALTLVYLLGAFEPGVAVAG